MAAIRCAAAGIALVRRAAAGGQRGALQQIFSSLRPRGIHSLLDRPLGTGAGALPSPTSSMGPARCVAPSNRYMSTSRFQQKGHSAATKEPSAKVPWYKRMWRPQETEGGGFRLCVLPLTLAMLYEAWDSYDEFESRSGEFSRCEFSVP